MGSGRDVIRDWESIDRIDLSSLDANSTLAGKQGFTFLGKGAASNVVEQGMLKYFQTGGDTYVVGNVTPDSTADFQIRLIGLHTLTADNFDLVA